MTSERRQPDDWVLWEALLTLGEQELWMQPLSGWSP